MPSSLAPECNVFKERYDMCFLKWYSEKYLMGNATTDECVPLFKEYRKCLNVTLKQKGIDAMINDAQRENHQNDQNYTKRS